MQYLIREKLHPLSGGTGGAKVPICRDMCLITAVLSEAWAKLHVWASVAGRAGCYSQAALPMPLSETAVHAF